MSLYNESGNFLGPAIFDTKQEAQEYLKQYESKMLARLTSIKDSNKDKNNHEKQQKQQNQKKRGEDQMVIKRKIMIREENQVDDQQQMDMLS